MTELAKKLAQNGLEFNICKSVKFGILSFYIPNSVFRIPNSNLPLPNFPSSGVYIHYRHLDIHQHKLKRPILICPFDLFQSLFAGGCQIDLKIK